MKILVIADVKDKASLEKLKSVQGDVYLLVGANVKKEDVPEGIQVIEYGTFKLSQFDKKIFIQSENANFNNEVHNLLRNFKTHTGSYRPFIWRKEVGDGQSLNVEQIFNEAHKQDCARFILRFNVFNPDMRYLNAKKTKLYLQRAFIRAGFPARKKKVFFTDQWKFKEFSYGIDYCVGQLTDPLKGDMTEWVNKLNEHLVEFGIKAERLEIYSMAVKPGELYDYFLSEVYTDFDYSQTVQAVKSLLDSTEYQVKIKVPGLMRDSWVTQQIDARPHIKDLWVEQRNGKTLIRMIAAPPVNLYTILPSMMKTSLANCYRFPVHRLEFFKKADEGAFDFLAATCEVSGNQIEKNVFDEPINDRFCARHIPASEEVYFSSEALTEQQEAEDSKLFEGSDDAQYLDTDNDTTDVAGEGDSLQDEE